MPPPFPSKFPGRLNAIASLLASDSGVRHWFMSGWLFLLLSWLATALGGTCDLQVLQKHSAGWMDLIQAPPGPRQDPAPIQRRPTRVSTAASDSGVFVSTSRFLALPWCPHRWTPLNQTRGGQLGHWSHPRRTIRPTNSRQSRPHQSRDTIRSKGTWTFFRWTEAGAICRLLTWWTVAPVFQDQDLRRLISLSSPPRGPLQSARCWRFASARCCAPSERHVHAGPTWNRLHSLCATRLPLSQQHPRPQPYAQVLPLPPHVAASWACPHHSGANQYWLGPDRGCFSGLGKRRLEGSFPTWLLPPTGLVAQPRKHAHLVPVSPNTFGSREAAQPGSHTTIGYTASALSVGFQPLQGSQTAQASEEPRVPWFAPVAFRSHQVWVASVSSSGLNGHGLKTRADNLGALVSCMGKRGKRAGRRRRPRDTERETHRPPKRFRNVGTAGDDCGSSSESSDGLGDDSGARPARPLTVFSAGAARMASTTNPASGSRPPASESRAEDADQFFDVSDLRVERSPEEFMALAAALGRNYAVPASAPTRHEPAPRPPTPPVAPVRSHTGERHWPAGALPPRPRQGLPKPLASDRGGPSVNTAADRTDASLRPRRFPAMDDPFHTSIGGARTHVGGSFAGIPTPAETSDVERPVRAFAKPTPKVRGRGRPVTATPVADVGISDVSGATAGTDNISPATEEMPGLTQDEVAAPAPPESTPHAVECCAEEITVPGIADQMAEVTAPVAEETRSVPTLATQVWDDTSEEDDEEDQDDAELTRMRRRGDLPVRVNISTGLPSGVARLKRDPTTGRIQVVRPPGYHLAHGGHTIAVDNRFVVYLDELRGFDRGPNDARQYMQGRDGSGYDLGFSRQPLFHIALVPCSAIEALHHLGSSIAPHPLANSIPHWICYVKRPPTHDDCSPSPGRSLQEPRGCRRPHLVVYAEVRSVFPGSSGVDASDFLGRQFLGTALSVFDFAWLEASCVPSPSSHRGPGWCQVRPQYPRCCIATVIPPGSSFTCPPLRKQLRLLNQNLSAHNTGCSSCSGESQLWHTWVDMPVFPWHLPTLLKNRFSCRHPWARRPCRTSSALTRGVALHRRSRASMCQQRDQLLSQALAPVTYHFWDLWAACSHVFAGYMTGNLHRGTVAYGMPGPHSQGLRFPPRPVRLGSPLHDTIMPQNLPDCAHPLSLPRLGTNYHARGHSVLPFNMQGSPGPKSGRCGRQTSCRFLSTLGVLLLHMQAAGATTTPDARVPPASQVGGEAGRITPAPQQAPAKPLGTRGATCVSHPPSLQRQRIVKRSLMRVHRRILRTGGAWYKGRWYDQTNASALQQPQPRHSLEFTSSFIQRRSHTSQPSRPAPSPDTPSQRLNVYTWNVGSLGGGLYDEILIHIHQNPVDVLLLQETKWRFSSCWDTNQYFFIHSGSATKDFKQGGLLTVISKKLVDQGSLRYVEPLPGRLHRVQFSRRSQPCDLINFYQHAWHDTEHIRTLRHQALDGLTRVIQQVPKRSLLIVGGDFNTSCACSAPHIGAQLLPPPPRWATDQEDLQAMVLGLDLCVLNTFQSSHPPHTYCWGTQRSHIDFIMIKRDLADGHSRQSHAQHDHPLGCWRGGARHFPVHASIPVTWRPWSQSSQAAAKAIDRHAIADALAGKADPRVQIFRRELHTQLDSIRHDLTALHDAVHSLAIKHFPKKAPVREQRPWQDGTLQQYASLMWGHLRKLRRWASRPAAFQHAQALFRCWRHSVQFARMHRMAQRQGKELRRARRANLLMQADQAISSGSSRLFYQLVDKLAPKGRYRKFQLSRGGSILTPEEELDTMRKHFMQVFNGDNTHLPPIPEPREEDSSFPVDSRELQVFLDKLPARKAGAPHTAPGAVWRICSDLVAAPLAAILTQRWSQAPLQPPENWAKATLSLLLKPHKTGSSPKDFRPIGLLDALGKASISMLLSKLRFDLETYVRTTPQFAYVTGRSTSDALRRVFLHNRDARALRSPSTRDPHFKRAGGHSPSLQGGLQICLDLTSAFDYVPRHLIAEALHEAGITGSPAELLLNWLHHCTYDLYIDQQHTCIPTNRGVKQGCPASPLLFAAFMTLVTRRLSSRLTAEWVERCLTMFADDFHVGQCFHSFSELETLSAQIGFIMSTLRSHGMSVHATKAKAIITVEGTKRSTAVKKLVRISDDGRLFRIHTRQGDEFLPLVRQADYLGAVTTYDSHASATLRRRTLLAKATHSRLRCVLHAHRTLTITHRIRLWRATVWPCLAYGLEVCGLSDEQHAQVQTLVLKHLRGIARCPAHITHESDVDLLARVHVPSPRDALRKTFESAFGRQEPDDPHVLPYDHEWNLHLASRLKLVSAPARASSSACPASQPQFAAVPLSTPTLTHPTEHSTATRIPSPVAPSVHTLPDQVTHDLQVVSLMNTDVPTSADRRVIPTSFDCPVCHKCCPDRKTLKLHMARVHKTQVPKHPFDRTQHSVDGVPTCALCRHAFTRWEVLAKHISSWSCPAMPLPPTHTAASPEPTPTLPSTPAGASSLTPKVYPPQLIATASQPPASQVLEPRGPAPQTGAESERDDVAAPCSQPDHTSMDGTTLSPPVIFETLTSTLRAGGLSALLRHPVKTSLLHICGLCGQWLATPTALKNHFRDLHSQLFLRYAARASQQGPRIGVAFNPCLYCNRSHRHPTQHLAHCVSLWQCCFFSLLVEDDGHPGIHPSDGCLHADTGPTPGELRQRAHGSGEEGNGGEADRRTPGPPSESRPRLSGLGRTGQGLSGQGRASSSGQKPERTPAERQRQLQLSQWFHHGRGGCRTAPSGGSGNHPPRGHLERPSSIHRMGLLDPIGRPLDSAHAGRSGGQMARGCGEARDSGRSSQPQGDPSLGHLHDLEGEAVPSLAGAAGLRQSRLVDRHVQQLELPEMGPPASDAHCGHLPPPPQPGPNPGKPCYPSSGDQRGHPYTVRSHEGPQCGHAGHGSLSGGHQPASPGLRGALHRACPTAGLSDLSDHRDSVSTGGLQACPRDPTHPASDWLRRVILSNHSNTCYLNSLVLCLAWVVLHTPPLRDSLSDCGRLALDVVLTGPPGPINLLRCRPWQQLLRHWAQPTRQHDAAELFLHLAPLMGSQVFDGGWEARRQEPGSVRVLDGGACAATISLDLPGRNTDSVLQQLINDWHHQHTIHALIQSPPVLVLRLSRFLDTRRGVRKHTGLVSWDSTIHVPSFSSAELDSQVCAYQVLATVCHQGANATSGHYTATLHHRQQAWFCDDNTRPRPWSVDSALPATLTSRQVYLLICRRGDLAD